MTEKVETRKTFTGLNFDKTNNFVDLHCILGAITKYKIMSDKNSILLRSLKNK